MNRKTIFAYIRNRIKILLLFTLFTGVFAVTFRLDNLPVTTVGYAFLLCAFIGFVILIIDFILFYIKHKQLSEMTDSITINMDNMPKSASLIETDYQNLLHVLYDENKKNSMEYEAIISDMTDYYTLWVHQIKTPISAMHLLLQSKGNSTDENLKLELFKIEQYADMVLSYLRINSTSSDLVLMKYSLAEIVRQAIRKYSLIFIHKKIKLNFNDFDYKVLTDEKWLVFVIEQILSNSLKYTANGGEISIYLNNENNLVIQDNGIGIAQEDIPRVFDKGYTGYNGRIYKKSTGVGLYLCKKIITRLSHTIAIKSDIGNGTKVIIGFRLADISAE